ncbi:CAP secretory protein [Perilla frutescens var. hirtella]|uniref:CAP secretory protein n=1 Tax=Perilla frutescens var. hirtella TaxID=608512 RepID=A0AAD4JKB1_PERFH|nr:CAP secretory protein [Perilla frutescens var. hirtella]KAH6817490.1 CAP secretory protein [Perilla frutescens var. frutescens]KAH6835423.1 CAP secretory protein [Perilla frutescens var. hirtella]
MINPPFYYAFILVLFFLTSTTTAAAATQQNEVQQFLGVQNAARSALRLPPLAWDAKIARYAAGYAGQRRGDCALQHSNGPYGENIFWGSGNRWTAAQAAAAWVSERRGYNYWSNSCAYGQDCGHYTQIVWRGTTRVGCARVLCYGGRGVFMICNYDPPGNYIGERPY